MAILSIQSHVAYGHVGNAAVTLPLQRLGREVWAVPTVVFAAHAGYGPPQGAVLPASTVGEIVRGIEARGVFPRCKAVLSGYLGDADLGSVVLDAVARVRSANPDALYCCDPVMGDTAPGVYVRDGIPEFLATQAVPVADIATPNVFELEMLAGGAGAGFGRRPRRRAGSHRARAPARARDELEARGDARRNDRNVGRNAGRGVARGDAGIRSRSRAERGG
jgi:pyridoxine kinase